MIIMEKEIQANKDSITIRKDSLWKYSTFALLGMLLIVAFFVFTDNRGSVTGNVIANPSPTQPGQAERVEVKIQDAPLLGNKNAPVVVVEYSDFQCPFCRKLWQETIIPLKRDYVETGKVALYFKDFPLSFHEGAETYAEAARCAREKGGDAGYWEMHDKIFQEQNILDGGTVKSTVAYPGADTVKKWARDIGYDIGSCLDSGKYKEAVQKDASEGAIDGVTGTPGTFVNGKLISGAQPYAAFKAAIDAELAAG